MMAVVYRSLSKDGDYVAITPPFATLTGEYLDTDADRTDYWYVATMLNWATGEIVYQTPPTTPGGHGDDRWQVRHPETTEVVTTNLGGWRERVRSNRFIGSYPERLKSHLQTWVRRNLMGPMRRPGGAGGVRRYHPERHLARYALWERARLLRELRLRDMRDGVERALLQFDLSSLPVGAVINLAEVSAYVESFTVQPEGEPVDVGLRPVLGAWDEGTVTWNTAPSVGQRGIDRHGR